MNIPKSKFSFSELKRIFFSQKGASFAFAVFLLVFILGIAMGISGIIIKQIKITREIGYSVTAFYAADHGIEEVLLMDPPADVQGVITINGSQAAYDVTVYVGGGPDCASDNYCITSVGEFKSIKRAIEVAY